MDKYTKLGSDGLVDVAASVENYTSALTAWKQENELPTDDIATAVNTVLGRSQGRVKMPALLSFVVNEIGGDPANFSSLSKRVHKYVRAEIEAGRLFAIRGPGGGVGMEAPAPKSA